MIVSIVNRPPRSSIVCFAAMVFSCFLRPASAVAHEPPPDGPRDGDRPRERRMDRDGDWGGPRGERPRDRTRRWRDDRRDGDVGPDAELPPDMTERIMVMLRDNFPEYHTRLERARLRNPERFRVALRQIVPIYREYTMLLRDERPELAAGIVEEFKNEKRLAELSRKYQDAKDDPARQAEVGNEIEPIVRRQMELQQQRLAFRLERFENRIKEQQELLQRQRQRFDEEKSGFEDRVARRIEDIKSGDLRRPFERRGPGRPDDFSEGPPRGPHRPGDGPPRRFRGPHGDPPEDQPFDDQPDDE